MTKVMMAHASLQYSDTSAQQASDLEKLFNRGADLGWGWITGTEAGPGAGKQGEYIEKYGKASGFKVWVPSEKKTGTGQNTDCWVAVNKNVVSSGWKTHYKQVLGGSAQSGSSRRYGPKGLIWCEWDNDELGHISVNASHYLTGGRSPKNATYGKANHWQENKKLGQAISDWAITQGRGKKLAFYGGDQNMADNKNKEPQGDTFFGGPLTSCWDELGKWEGTGHGNIDVIASYNKDKRVKAVRARALDDREFFLHSDHFMIEAVYEVRELEKASG